MKYFKLVFPLLAIFFISGCNKRSDLITGKEYREVLRDFEQRKLMFEGRTLFGIFEEAQLTTQESDALTFLYAYMPLVDLADYNGEYFLSMTRAAINARNTFHWGKKVPADLFRHFVLPPRVNNENLDTARIVFFNELKERIKDMSMYDAALEVNHWCHEKITYRPSDSRTSAPLASMKTGFGRCGEESTFTVTALRAVGIPARQCYTPRWAHTDDNHAWVEVWCDGKWYFMGACEPEPELNLAWFTYPAKRAMMVHTNVFGKYYGPESKTGYPLYTKINVLENYTDTKRAEVTVYDSVGNLVEGAVVKYLIYNYSEYYPVYEKPTGKDGKSEVISGAGDMLIWASKDSSYGYCRASLANESKFTVKLENVPGKEYSEELDLTPPDEQARFTSADDNPGRVKNNLRLKYEDSLRTAYLSTFMTREAAVILARQNNLDPSLVGGFIERSEGNWGEIFRFIAGNSKNENTLRILSTLTDKDLRDTPAEVLQSHLDNTSPFDKDAGYGPVVYVKGILSPGVSTELIRKWRPVLREKFRDIFSENPGHNTIKSWVTENIRVDNSQNYPNCPISPIGVLNAGMADRRSRDIFFVALCRSFNIPAYIDMATSAILVWEKGSWSSISFDPAAPPSRNGELVLNYTGGYIPKYWIHFTVSKFQNGIFEPLDYENDSRVSLFPVRLDLEEGYYRLTTGNRYSDGKVLAHNEYFNIRQGESVTKELIIRKLEAENKVYGKLDSVVNPSLYEKGLVICFLEPDREPTKHLMNELSEQKDVFDKWEGSFMFAITSDKLPVGFSAKMYKGIPVRSAFITGKESANKIRANNESTNHEGANQKAAKNSSNTPFTNLSPQELMTVFLQSADQSFRDNYPLIYIVNPNGEIIFHSEGYKIGLPDLIRRSLPVR